MKFDPLSPVILGIPDSVTVKDFYSIPEVYQMSNGTGGSCPFDMTFSEYLEDKGFRFLSFVLENQLIGIIHYRYLTDICVEAHINVLPKYHKQGLGKEILEIAIDWFKCKEEDTTFMTYVPSNCPHVLKFMLDNQFTAAGCIPNSVYYNNQLVNLFIFTRG